MALVVVVRLVEMKWAVRCFVVGCGWINQWKKDPISDTGCGEECVCLDEDNKTGEQVQAAGTWDTDGNC